MQSLTDQNQTLVSQLSDAQTNAQELAAAKEDFVRTMKEMRRERELLDERVRRAAEAAEGEKATAEQQHSQLERKMRTLELERVGMADKLKVGI
jgi:F0F1-type ATP synthase membrane subunit b/b'